MVVNDRLVFVELHKTGCTHIGKWLIRLIGGERIGKHNRVPPHLWDRFILGSIRNPWDWYVSLWAFGCQGKGSVRRQTTRGLDLGYVWRQLDKEMGRKGLTATIWMRQCWNDLRKPVNEWRDAYRDARDPIHFRAWLRMLLDPRRKLDMGEGFGFSPVAEAHGLLTYRFLKLFTKVGQGLYRDPALVSPEGVEALWANERLVDFVVRTEHLEDDLLQALVRSGHELPASHADALMESRARKTNVSSREAVDYYYDDASIQLVASRERLIISEFGYLPPSHADTGT